MDAALDDDRAGRRPAGAGVGVPAGLIAAAVTTTVLLVVLLVVAAWIETGPGSWYAAQERSTWTPEASAFGGIVVVPFLCLAVASALVVRRGLWPRGVRGALVAHAVELVVLLVWVRLLFVDERPGAALVAMAAWVVALAVTGVGFAKVSPIAGVLVVPAIAWVLAAMSVVVGILVLGI